MSRKRSRARVGAKLRKARERCGLSLRQIADSTKISVSVLEGLERDDISYLPGGVLGRGYVRSFAAAVRMDPEITVAEFVAQFPESSVTNGYPPAARVDGDTVAESRPSRTATKIHLNDSGRFARAASVGVIAVLLAGVVAFAAPRGWPPWSALQSWAMRVPADRVDDSSVDVSIKAAHEKQLRTLEARPIRVSRPSKSPTLPASRRLPMTISAQVNPAAVATSSGISSTVAPAPPTPDVTTS